MQVVSVLPWRSWQSFTLDWQKGIKINVAAPSIQTVASQGEELSQFAGLHVIRPVLQYEIAENPEASGATRCAIHMGTKLRGQNGFGCSTFPVRSVSP